MAAGLWLDGAAKTVPVTPTIAKRAQTLTTLGFRPFDALHIAFGEAAGARLLVTCDDQFLGLAGRHRERLQIAIVRPDAVALGGPA